MRLAWKMYFEISGVSKRNFGWIQEKPKVQARCAMWDTGYGMKISLPVHVQNVLILTSKFGINLVLRGLRGGMLDEKQQIRPTK